MLSSSSAGSGSIYLHAHQAHHARRSTRSRRPPARRSACTSLLEEHVGHRRPRRRRSSSPSLGSGVVFDDVSLVLPRPGRAPRSIHELSLELRAGRDAGAGRRTRARARPRWSTSWRASSTPTSGRVTRRTATDLRDVSAWTSWTQPVRDGRAGPVPVPHLDRARTSATAGRTRRRRTSRPPRARPTSTTSSSACPRATTRTVGDIGRAPLGRPAPAHHHRARDPQGRAAAPARRGDQRARQRVGGRSCRRRWTA